MFLRVLGQLPPRKIAPNPKANPNPYPNPNPKRGAIFHGGNCPDTFLRSIKETNWLISKGYTTEIVPIEKN